MANSRKSKHAEVEHQVAAALARHVPPHANLILGFSGGIDSRVLLDVLAKLAVTYPFRLACLHVHHGISPNADAWAGFAERTAAAYGLTCTIEGVDIRQHRRAGVEAAARTARYEVFARADADFILSAQHLDDQAETLLLQLARGAGVAGLAAMPEVRELAQGKMLLRPLLDVSRAQIESYAEAHALEWVEDESNGDVSLARNYLRHEIMPRLSRLNTGAAANLARSAKHLGEAQALLQEVADTDARLYVRGPVLKMAALKDLNPARARNLLRAWFGAAGAGIPACEELEEIYKQLRNAKIDAQVQCARGDFLLRRYRDEARLIRAAGATPALNAVWRGDREWLLPELGGRFRFEYVRGGGIRAEAMRGLVQARVREGGERFRPDARRPRRSLKKLLQEQGIAPWERERLPLLYCDDRLAFVPGIGICADLQAGAGETGLEVRWHPDL